MLPEEYRNIGLLGSTVDTCSYVCLVACWISHDFLRAGDLGSGVDSQSPEDYRIIFGFSGDHFRKCWRLLDSGNALMRQFTGLSRNLTHFLRDDGLRERTSGKSLRIQRCAWFNSGCSSCVCLRSFLKDLTLFLCKDVLWDDFWIMSSYSTFCLARQWCSPCISPQSSSKFSHFFYVKTDSGMTSGNCSCSVALA